MSLLDRRRPQYVIALLVAGIAFAPLAADAEPPSAAASAPPPARRAPGPNLGDGEPITGHHPKNQILFTYDDGPDIRTSNRVLELLEREGIQAVFFVNGYRFDRKSPFSQKNRELLQKIYAAGHVIGNHTYNHARLSVLTPAALTREIASNEEAVLRATGERPTLFRAPYGDMPGTMWKVLTERGLTHMRWSIDPSDLALFDRKKIAERVTREIKRLGGGVVILHDINPAAAGATQLILDWLRKESCARIARGEPPYEIVGPDAFHRPRAPGAPASGTPRARPKKPSPGNAWAPQPTLVAAAVAPPPRPAGKRLRLDRCPELASPSSDNPKRPTAP